VIAPRGLLLAGLLVAVVAPMASGRVISRSAEISVGRETASQVQQYFRVDTDPVAAARVRQIGRRLISCAENTDYPFEFHVVEEGEINAFALPGGFVYVFRGLLQLLPSDDALASVIAHEIIHVTRRHAVRQFEKNLVLSAGITAVLAGTGAGSGARDAAGVAQAVAGLSFTRGDESEADEEGIRLLARAGYDPRGAVAAMEIIRRVAGGGREPAFLMDHPAPERRVRRLKALAEALRSEQPRDTGFQPTAAPTEPPRRINGLEGVALAPCEWVPLRPGMVWSYRIRSAAGETPLTVRILEELAAEPHGVYRVQVQMGPVRTHRLVAAADDRLFSRPEAPAGAPWRAEALFAAGREMKSGEGAVRLAGAEAVSVPAGSYANAARVELVGADGKLRATSWYARGVGLVRRVDEGGTVEELLQLTVPPAP
jgi:Zn-dependent protease with chaperone function